MRHVVLTPQTDHKTPHIRVLITTNATSPMGAALLPRSSSWVLSIVLPLKQYSTSPQHYYRPVMYTSEGTAPTAGETPAAVPRSGRSWGSPKNPMASPHFFA